MKKIAFVLCILFVFSASLSSVSAAKKRIRKTAVRATGASYSQARLSRATNSVVVSFLNLGLVKRVDYALSYTANGIPQGVVGAIAPSGQTTDGRDFYFGTCSKGVCTSHTSIQNASLTITTTLMSGATHTKRYRIKI